jgi:tetratricopeptide (TPR) repeat protein
MKRLKCCVLIGMVLLANCSKNKNSVNQQETNPLEGVYFYTTAKLPQGEFDKAIIDFTEAIGLDLNNIDAYLNRGIAYYYKDDPDRAIADLELLLMIEPNNANAMNYIEIAKQEQEQAK